MQLPGPDQAKCHSLVYEAVKNGTLIRPSTCDECATTPSRLHAHHADYTKPFDVAWLCPKCHGARHAKGSTRKQYNLRLPEDLIQKMDETRGDIPRTRFIERAIEAVLPSLEVPDAHLAVAQTKDEKQPHRPSHPITDEVEGITVAAPEQLYRCPVHHDSLRPSPAGRCFCNRKTSEPV